MPYSRNIDIKAHIDSFRYLALCSPSLVTCFMYEQNRSFCIGLPLAALIARTRHAFQIKSVGYFIAIVLDKMKACIEIIKKNLKVQH